MKYKESLIVISAFAVAIGVGICHSVRNDFKKSEVVTITKIETESENSNEIQTTAMINNSKGTITTKNKTKKKKSETSASSEKNSDILVNINTADHDTLVKLNGIGDSLADRIIEYRNENGDFKNIEELLNVPGIGEKIFNAVKDNIYVEDPIYDSEDSVPLYINLNTATHDELVKLYKIGDNLADEIIKYREANGPFNNIEEIMNVPGISEGIFSFIRENIYVENPFYPEEIIENTEIPTEEPITQPYEPEIIPPVLTLEDVAPIELNTADIEVLKLLPHVDDEKAEDIIELRSEIVVFSNVYELLYVESLTDEQVIDILPYVYVG